MKIHDMAGTANAARIRIVVTGKGVDDQIDYVPVDLLSAEQKQPAFLAMNPIGKTPLLELEDGLIISECTAITEYLDNADGNPVFTGSSPREKAVIHMMQRRVEQLVLEPVDDLFHYGTAGLGEALAPWRLADWAGRQDWAERRGRAAVQGFAYFESIIRREPFLAQDSFTMPDITLYISLGFAEVAGLSLGKFPALSEWRAKIEELPAVANRSGKSLPAEVIARLPRHAAPA